MKDSIQIRNPISTLRSMFQRFIGTQTGSKTVVIGSPYSYGSPFDMTQYAHAYRISPYVFRCVSTVADNFAQVPLKVIKKKVVGGKTETETLTDHDLVRLLDSPNSYLSGYELKKNTEAFLELNGNAYWLILRIGSGRAVEIHMLRPDRVVIVPDEERFVKGYIYRVGNASYKFDADDVIHFKNFSPYEDYYGQATLEAARATINLDHKARKYNDKFFENSAMPRGAIAYDQKLEDEDYDDIELAWKKSYSGIDNAHKIGIFEKGAKWLNIGISQKDMEFIEMMKLSRDEIASVFGVPPVMINDFEKASYNNAREQVGLFWHETEIPKLTHFESHLNHKLHKLLARNESARQQIEVRFDLSQVWALQTEETERTESELAQVTAGTLTINEFRASRGREPVEWGDDWSKQAQTVLTAPAKRLLAKPDLPAFYHKAFSLIDAPVEERSELSDFDEWKGFVIHSDRYETLMKTYFLSLLKDQEAIVKRLMRQHSDRLKAAVIREEEAKTDGAGHIFVKLTLDDDAETEILITKATEADIEAVLFDLEKAIDYTEESSTTLFTDMTETGGKRGFTMARVRGSFDVTNPRAVSIMKNKKQKFAQKINETTWGKLKNSLVIGIKDGDSISSLADRVALTFKKRRSDKYVIARTEVIGSLNGGIHEGYKQTGVVKSKGWLDAHDEATREAHRKVGRQKMIPLDEHFKLINKDGSTSRLMYPGDPAGDAEQVIQCRCTLKPGKIGKELMS